MRAHGTPDDVESSGRRQITGHLAGDKIGTKYRLVSLLGQGGMGSVWHARNLALDTDVALKLILPLEGDDAEDEANERLLREARAAASIDHPSVVRVLDFGRSNTGEPFIVMELLRGTSLAELFDRRGRMPAGDAVELLLHIVSALAAAHDKGVIHRDLKPDNVMLTTTPEGSLLPKVFDFGIAKLKRNEGAKQLTLEGEVMGSPDYMAPEQARGAGDIDERADVWSVCALLYEAVTGRRPFHGANVSALLGAVIKDDPIPFTEGSTGELGLWPIVQKGLRKPVEERWQSMAALGEALTAWLARASVPPEPMSDRPEPTSAPQVLPPRQNPRQKARVAFIAAGLALVAIAALLTYGRARSTVPAGVASEPPGAPSRSVAPFPSTPPSLSVAPPANDNPVVAPSASEVVPVAPVAPVAPFPMLDPPTATATATAAPGSSAKSPRSPAKPKGPPRPLPLPTAPNF